MYCLFPFASQSSIKRARLDVLTKLNINKTFDVENQGQSVDQEVYKYQTTTINFPLDGDHGKFWIDHKKDFPILFELARIIFSISPTSASAERVFSLMGALLNKRRACLNSAKAKKVMFVHNNSHLLYTD